MYAFIQMVGNFFANIFNLLNTVSFYFGGVTVSYSELLLGFIGISIVITVFWKGARG